MEPSSGPGCASGGEAGQSCTLMCGCVGWALEQHLKLVFSTDITHRVQDECVNTASTDGHSHTVCVCDSVVYQMP